MLCERAAQKVEAERARAATRRLAGRTDLSQLTVPEKSLSGNVKQGKMKSLKVASCGTGLFEENTPLNE